MSIAEKLTTIAENQQRVYDAGYAVADRHGQITANLRYQEGLEEGFQNGYVYGESDGITQGMQNAYDEFWDTYQQNGNRTSYLCSFGAGWTDEIFKPKYPINATSIADRMFSGSDIKNINVPIRIGTGSANALFHLSLVENVQELILTKPTNVLSWMSYAHYVKEIRITCEGTGCLGNGSDVTCGATTLSHDSLVSIAYALQDLVPLGQTYKFSIGSTNIAKLSTAEIAIATQKGWTVV